MAHADLTPQVHRVFGADGEGHAIELGVAPQQVLVERRMVFFGGGGEVGLVVQRALPEDQPVSGLLK